MAKTLLKTRSTRLTWRAKLTLLGVFVGIPLLLWSLRLPLARLFPIDHEGVVKRIKTFNKGGFSSRAEGTRQLVQFAIIFEDGFQCEGYDTSFAAVEVGDHIQMRGYHDVKGMPVMDPEWWECDEGQLIGLVE